MTASWIIAIAAWIVMAVLIGIALLTKPKRLDPPEGKQ